MIILTVGIQLLGKFLANQLIEYQLKKDNKPRPLYDNIDSGNSTTRETPG